MNRLFKEKIHALVETPRQKAFSSSQGINMGFYFPIRDKPENTTWGRQRTAQDQADPGFSQENGSRWRFICSTLVNKPSGAPDVAQWLTNPTGNHEVSGLNPGLAQWLKDLALP